MKKSRQIQLVLITAVLASCNRAFVPAPAVDRAQVDSLLTAAPVDGADSGMSYAGFCNLQPCHLLWNYSFDPHSGYYAGPWGSYYDYYYPGTLYRRGSLWRNNHFVVRNGFGKTAFSAAS